MKYFTFYVTAAVIIILTYINIDKYGFEQVKTITLISVILWISGLLGFLWTNRSTKK